MNDRLQYIHDAKSRLDTTSDSRVLGALGHPGYSDRFAWTVLDAWHNGSGNLHDIVYGPIGTKAANTATN